MPQILPQTRDKDARSLTREELYEKVWTTSSVQVAKSLGVSDVAIAKICKRFNIPKPPLGYWAKVQSGMSIPRAPLPAAPDGLPNLIFIGGQKFLLPKPAKSQQVAIKKALHIPENVPLAHPLVKKTLSALMKEKEDKYGRVSVWGEEGYLNVAVGKNNIQQALRVMQILINNLEGMGYPVSLVNKSERSWNTIAKVENEPVKFRIEEPSNRAKRTTPPKNKWDTDQWVFIPSGRLVLIIEEYAEGLQRQWRVAINKTLGETLSSFISGLIEMAKAIKVRKARWEKERLETEAVMQRQMAEAERVRQLKSLTAGWDESQKMRAFLDTLEKKILEQGGDDPISGARKWIAWAKEYLDRIDPIEEIIRNMNQNN